MNFHFKGKWRIPVERKEGKKSKLSGKYKINYVFSPPHLDEGRCLDYLS